MNLAACGALPAFPENRTWYRAIGVSYLPSALQTAHTKGSSSRFNPGPLLAPADWRGYQTRGPHRPIPLPVGQAPTQELGRHIFRSGIEGFLSPSAKIATNQNLVIFPQKLRSGSRVTYTRQQWPDRTPHSVIGVTVTVYLIPAPVPARGNHVNCHRNFR